MNSVDQEIATPKTAHNDQIVQLFEDARRRLVETGTRNRLIHVNRANTRGPVLNVINERSDDVYAALSGQKAMRFLARGADRTDETETSLALPEPEEAMDPARFVDEFLETPLGPDGLQKKLLTIAQQARTAEEEQGVNILYLALGFLTWYEAENSRVPRVAPLILLPVDLVRNQRTSSFDLRLREEDIVTNLPLSIRLNTDFNMRLPEVDVDEEWTPSQYFDQVEMASNPWPSWSVERDAMQLGFFSFSKLLMFQDLSPDAWPNDSLKQHALTRGLLFEGFGGQNRLEELEGRLDAVLPPSKLFHVVDADASQAIAIEEVRGGRNLVIQGPPGTGKSQTICNIIATCVREGKTVLFVAEKMAALSVVHERLVKVGLRDVCLELHSKSANKKAVLGELSRTLDAAQAIPRTPGEPTELTATRDKLNAIADALHQPVGATGETCISVLGKQARYLGMGYSAPAFTSQRLKSMSSTEEDELCALIEQYGALVKEIGPPDSHSLRLLQRLDMQPTDLARSANALNQAIDAAEALREVLEAGAMALKVSPTIKRSEAPSLATLLNTLISFPGGSVSTATACLGASDRKRLAHALEVGQQWRDSATAARQRFLAQALEAPIFSIRAAIAGGCTSFFRRFGSAYKQASVQLGGYLSSPLPKAAEDRLALVDELLEVQSRRKLLRDEEAYCAESLGELWRGEQTNFGQLRIIASWLVQVEQSLKGVPIENAIALAADRSQLNSLIGLLGQRVPEADRALEELRRVLSIDLRSLELTEDGAEKPLGEVIESLRKLHLQMKDYSSFCRSVRIGEKMRELGLESLVALIQAGKIMAERAIVELRFARAEELWGEARRLYPILQDLDGIDRHGLVTSFARLERDHLRNNVTQLRAKHLSQLPTGALGEMRVVRGEIGKKRGHIPLRRLMNSAPHAIQRIKPVFLMSPISVAQYLQPGSLKFDVLIIDEASQVRPQDALGAIARAGQVVVVGDPRQLPPTSFFERLLLDDQEREEDEEEDNGEILLGGAAKLDELESILTLCEARGLHRRMLKWHYRSKDPSLIQVSNAEFYDNELVLLPSPLKSDPRFGLCFTRVVGVYDRGGKRDNRLEGEALVRRVAEHARTAPEHSLGIATFSVAQRNLITELLELARRTDSTLDEFLRETSQESVFIKNIENIQGDERDVILVSVCYGPATAGGRLSSLSFGPVNGEGGERRLNVLFTRARLRCEVFASFDPSEIDLSRARGEGVRIFKRYLDFAQHGKSEQDVPTGEGAETPLEQDVADVIRGMGFLADPQVGSCGFRIDIGVRHPSSPGKYLLAVECDGATYHQALWARERDRMRQELLEHLGWRFHRIWSTDWFYNRPQEIERLRQALHRALEGTQMKEGSVPIAEEEHTEANESASVTMSDVAPRTREIPSYRRAIFPANAEVEPHEAEPELLKSLVTRIVESEGPIHEDEVARRLAACFGKERTGARIQFVTKSALMRVAKANRRILNEDSFWLTEEQSRITPVRDRSNEEGPTLKAENISLHEIKAALNLAREDNGGGSDSELIRAAARYLGFRRVGQELQNRILYALQQEFVRSSR